jgi:hypothetical protein
VGYRDLENDKRFEVLPFADRKPIGAAHKFLTSPDLHLAVVDDKPEDEGLLCGRWTGDLHVRFVPALDSKYTCPGSRLYNIASVQSLGFGILNNFSSRPVHERLHY